jgi:hypothetical protein
MNRTINLVEGVFTPAEAADLINQLVDLKLNFHTLNRLSITEGNRHDDAKEDNSRIAELQKEKLLNKDYFKKAKAEGKRFTINSIIEIQVEE